MGRVEEQRIEPRGLSRTQAATYVGISPSLFDQMVRDRRMPQPKHINSRVVWDRRLLDEAFDALSADADELDEDWTVAV
jgi:predicted DNA-binding transcriptional regulator AlpA